MEYMFNEESEEQFFSQEFERNALSSNLNSGCIGYKKFELKGNIPKMQIKKLTWVWLDSERRDVSVENLNFIWCSEYSTDIIEYLKEAEKKRKKINFKSPQKEFRASLVQVVKYSAEILSLGRTTVHLAVYLLDVFMDTYAIIQNKLNAVALTCLLLASKIEERDSNVPKMERLCQISRSNSISELKKAEIRLLKFFEWNLLFPTGATYLEFYISKFLSKTDIINLLESNNLGFASENEIIDEGSSLVFEILDLTLQDQSLVQAPPSGIAAACLAVGRTILGLCNWNDDMFTMTGLRFYEIEKLYNILLHLRKRWDIEEKTKLTPDSGYLQSTDSDTESDETVCLSHCFKRRRIN